MPVAPVSNTGAVLAGPPVILLGKQQRMAQNLCMHMGDPEEDPGFGRAQL